MQRTNTAIIKALQSVMVLCLWLVASTSVFAQAAPSFTVTPASATLAEGESVTITVQMINGPPPRDALFVIGNPTPDYAVRNGLGSLTFTTVNWATAQTFRVTANNDVIDNSDDRRITEIPLIAFSLNNGAPAGSGPSTPLSVRITVTDNDTAPDAPTGLAAATAGSREIALSWAAPANTGTVNAVATAITGYEYRQKLASDANFSDDWQTIANSAPGDVNENSYTVTGLTNGTAYTFIVRAVNAAGKGAASTSDSETPVAPPAAATVPDAPVILRTAPTNNNALVQIQAPADNGGASITSYQYQLKQGTGAFGNWQDIGVDPPISAFLQNLAANTDYTVSVRAVNVAGNSAAVEASFTTLAVLGTPSGLTAVAGDGQVALSWTPSTQNGGQAITEYQYRQQVDGVWSDWLRIGNSGPGRPMRRVIPCPTWSTVRPTPLRCDHQVA